MKPVEADTQFCGKVCKQYKGCTPETPNMSASKLKTPASTGNLSTKTKQAKSPNTTLASLTDKILSKMER